ncbi:MAG TPA: hypothetical protein VHV78_02080 [Gemmatimonadaceae bacterium]|jgi:hypothetical protein|nr:hypothetical protein [Gemmatimonadaceae bacterium]
MNRKLISYLALCAVVGIGACTDKSIEVTNPNSGETQRVLGTPDDAEKLLGSYYKRWYQGLYGSVTANPPATLEGMANIMSFQNYSSLNNECQNSRYPFSGAANTNAPGNTCAPDQSNPYFILNEVVRVASNFLGNVADGSLNLGSDARAARDKSFAEFLRGISLGYLALTYDSSAVVTPGMSGSDAGKLITYSSVMDSAYAALQRAIDDANTTATGASGFPIPTAWIPTPTTLAAADFVKIIRSYRALFRADIARTPADRAAADWTSIIADAQAGLTADHYIVTDVTNGPGAGWRRIYDGGATWHQMTPFIIGMADTSGAYLTWVRTEIGNRGAGNVSFTMATPDTRFPQGATRAAQQADFKIQDCEINGGNGASGSFSCKRYFTNRPNGSDQFTGNGWGWSNYDFNRFHWWVIKGDGGTARSGTLLMYPKTVVDMLQAEGLIRKGSYAAAAALINLTRVKNGLPAITAADGTTPVPGGNACVPKTPFGSGASATLTCGTMLEAMKWEKRIEGSFVQFSGWYFDERGWGDLPQNTALFWAVPYQDLESRGYKTSAIYGAGVGAGNAPNSASGTSTYGW